MEIIYLGHDNKVDLRLDADGAGVDLSPVTRITASFDDSLVSSTSPSSGEITWAQEGYVSGEIRIDAGAHDLSQGLYNVYIVVYDSVNVNGLVWGECTPMRIRAEVEAQS